LLHPPMAPQDMTAALGMRPDHCWRAGEPRIGYKGRALDGVSAESYWTCLMEKGAWPPTTLASAIEAALGRLSSKRGFLRQIRSEGGGAEFFIGWFFETKATTRCLPPFWRRWPSLELTFRSTSTRSDGRRSAFCSQPTSPLPQAKAA